MNWANFRKKVSKAAEIKGTAVARRRAYNLFYRAKKKMLYDFNTHLVTLEIEGKGDFSTKNISGTLEGYGNLFSFIGFTAGARPTEPIRRLLESAYYLPNPVYRDNKWIFHIRYPSHKEVVDLAKDSTPRWSDGSWVDLIEKGAPGIIYYLNLKKSNKASRSNYGLQAGWEVNEDLSFQPQRYLNEILQNFRDRINSSNINEV